MMLSFVTTHGISGNVLFFVVGGNSHFCQKEISLDSMWLVSAMLMCHNRLSAVHHNAKILA